MVCVSVGCSCLWRGDGVQKWVKQMSTCMGNANGRAWAWAWLAKNHVTFRSQHMVSPLVYE